jgi:hypothetical protein
MRTPKMLDISNSGIEDEALGESFRRPIKGDAVCGFRLNMMLFLFAAFLLEPTVLQAAKYEFRAGGLSLWLPDDWGVNLAAKTMTGFPKDRDAFVKLSLITDVGNLDSAFRKYPETLRSYIPSYRETRARGLNSIAGLEAFSAGGEGIADGVKSYIQVFVFKAPRGFVVLLWSVVAEKADQFQPIFRRMTDSLRAGI